MSKISELSDGGSLTSTDYLIAVRSGGNVKVKMDTINVDQITLGDNEMIRLGNSQDLTMVHTSTQSIINQAGIGDLLIQKAGATKLTINASGLDVTGSVTADGLVTQATANTYPASAAQIKSLAGDISYITNVGGAFLISNSSSSDQFVLSSAGNVGIGTSSPSTKLTISQDSAGAYVGASVVNTNAGGYSNLALSAGAGTAGIYYAPSIFFAVGPATGDTTTPIVFRNNNATERMRIDAIGNVGIGVTPSAWAASSNALQVGIYAGLSKNDALGAGDLSYNAYLTTSASDSWSRIVANASSRIHQRDGSIQFKYGASGTAGGAITWSESMRIDSGNLLVGDTTRYSSAKFQVVFDGTNDNGAVLKTTRSATGSNFGVFLNSSNQVCGTITHNGSTTVNYATSSDQRLKSSIADADDAGSKIDAIQVRKFDWIKSGLHQDYGMVAQELLEVAPEAVSAPEDPDEMMGVDYSKLVPMLVKEIQSLRARIAALES